MEFPELRTVARFNPVNERRTFRRHTTKKEKDCETDALRLAQRRKQIQYGENTIGYANFVKALKLYPDLFRGCVPIKPAVTQKCSKRSWDGQIRKWRRALHMYDFVDFEDDEQASKSIRAALIEQNKNPWFSGNHAARKSPDEAIAEGPTLEDGPGEVPRVRYAFDQLLQCAESPQVAPSILLPEALQWLDKRVDLEDDVCDDSEPEPGSPSDPFWSPFTPGYVSETSPATPFGVLDTPVVNAPGVTPMAPLRLFPESPDAEAVRAKPHPFGQPSAVGCVKGVHTEANVLRGMDWGSLPDSPLQNMAGVLSLQAASTQMALPMFQLSCPAYAPLRELETGLQRLCV